MEFIKPELEYAELLPLLIVLGGACVGVNVEGQYPIARCR